MFIFWKKAFGGLAVRILSTDRPHTLVRLLSHFLRTKIIYFRKKTQEEDEVTAPHIQLKSTIAFPFSPITR